MKENAMRKWGGWAASAVLVAVTTMLAVAPGDRAEAKNSASVQAATPQAPRAAASLANADRDVLDMQLD